MRASAGESDHRIRQALQGLPACAAQILGKRNRGQPYPWPLLAARRDRRRGKTSGVPEVRPPASSGSGEPPKRAETRDQHATRITQRGASPTEPGIVAAGPSLLPICYTRACRPMMPRPHSSVVSLCRCGGRQWPRSNSRNRRPIPMQRPLRSGTRSDRARNREYLIEWRHDAVKPDEQRLNHFVAVPFPANSGNRPEINTAGPSYP